MKKIGNFELDNVYCGDSKELTKSIPDNSIDLIVTDPPYQLDSIKKRWGKNGKNTMHFDKSPHHRTIKGFMGKEWDVLPPIEVWQESLRILKPGAFAFIMTTPRQDSLCQILMDLTNAGFNMGFSSIYWTYASGFPKASNIGKMVDKKPKRLLAGKMRDKLNKYRIKAGLSIKQINEYFGFATTGSGVAHHWMTHPTQPTIPTQEQYQKLKKLLKIENLSLDELYIEAKREVTRKDKNWGKKGSTPLTGYKEFERKDKPVTPQAKSLNGSYAGFQPKPAVEVIIVAMKPLSEKTYVDQALKNRKGITWLDDGRIPYESEEDKKSTIPFGDISKNKLYGRTSYLESKTINKFIKPPAKGRFPANLLVSDDVLNDGRTLRSGGRTGLKHSPEIFGNAKSNIGKTIELNPYQDSGSFSRYFDLDSWAVSQGVKDTFPFIVCAKASKSEKNKGCENLPLKIGGGMKGTENQTLLTGSGNIRNNKMKNIHPTVKPIKLMSYLIMLGSREGDIILDNFCGSGSTLVSAKKLNRRFLGFDTEMEYVEISKARLSAIKHVQDGML